MTTTLTPEKQAWADAHVGGLVEMALRGKVDPNPTVLDDGRVAFHVTGGYMIDDAGTPTFYEDGTEGTFIEAPPLSPDEVAAQLAERDAEEAAAQEHAQEVAAADAQVKSDEFHAAVAAEVAAQLVELGVIPAPDTSTPTS